MICSASSIYFNFQLAFFTSLAHSVLAVTDLAQATLGTVRFAGGADVAAMQQQPVVGGGYKLLGDVFQQGLLHGQWRGGSARYESESVAHSEHVGIDGESCFLEGDGLHHIGSLAAYTGERGEFLEGGGNLSVKSFDESLGKPYEMLGLVVGIAHALDVFEDLVGRSFSHCKRIGVGTP